MFETFEIKSVFEYGFKRCHALEQYGSFVENCENVVSVEMNTHKAGSQSSYDKMVEQIGERRNWVFKNCTAQTKLFRMQKNSSRNRSLI